MKAAICIGHSRSGDKGATSSGGVSEWTYNVPVGELVRDRLVAHGVEVLLLTDYQGGSYGSAMDWVAGQLDKFGADCAIELHFNAANGTAKGFEYLHWGTSTNGAQLASRIHRSHAETLGGTDRGLKPKSSGDRGSAFLSKPACPSVICEPFFGDNPSEWDAFRSESAQQVLAGVYADGILSYLGIESGDVPDPQPDIDSAIARIERAETELTDAKRILRGG